MSVQLSGFIARKTDKAIAFVSLPLSFDMKPLWIPISKISESTELDEYSPSVQLKGESIRRLAVPVELVIDSKFAEKVGVA